MHNVLACSGTDFKDFSAGRQKLLQDFQDRRLVPFAGFRIGQRDHTFTNSMG
jgi:hypothetical protein